MIERSEDEIHEQINAAADEIEAGKSRYFGMSYEEGVRAALEWAIGETDEAPMEDD